MGLNDNSGERRFNLFFQTKLSGRKFLLVSKYRVERFIEKTFEQIVVLLNRPEMPTGWDSRSDGSESLQATYWFALLRKFISLIYFI